MKQRRLCCRLTGHSRALPAIWPAKNSLTTTHWPGSSPTIRYEYTVLFAVCSVHIQSISLHRHHRLRRLLPCLSPHHTRADCVRACRVSLFACVCLWVCGPTRASETNHTGIRLEKKKKKPTRCTQPEQVLMPLPTSGPPIPLPGARTWHGQPTTLLMLAGEIAHCFTPRP